MASSICIHADESLVLAAESAILAGDVEDQFVTKLLVVSSKGWQVGAYDGYAFLARYRNDDRCCPPLIRGGVYRDQSSAASEEGDAASYWLLEVR